VHTRHARKHSSGRVRRAHVLRKNSLQDLGHSWAEAPHD